MKKVFWALNYFKHFPISVSTITECVSIFALASLNRVLVGIARSAVGLKVYLLLSHQ